VSLFKSGLDATLHAPRWLNVSCGAARCAQAGCAPGACDAPAHALKLSGAALAAALPRLLRPDVLVLNVGVHEPPDAREVPDALARYAGVAAAMAAITRGARGPRRDADLAAAWDEERAGAPPPAAPPAGAPAAPHAEESPRRRGPFRGLIWKVTTPGKDAALKEAAEWVAAGAPAAAPAAADARLLPPPAAPWPRAEAAIARAVRGAGGAVWDTAAILHPLVTPLARAGRAAAAFAHGIDSWHFAPAVNAELNKALLAMLCEGVDDEPDAE